MAFDRELNLKALREIQSTVESILSGEAPDFDEARIIDAFRTIDLLCRARLPAKLRHQTVHSSIGSGQDAGTACGTWWACGALTTGSVAEVTCKRCLQVLAKRRPALPTRRGPEPC